MKRTLLTAKNVCKSFAHEGGQIHVCNHVNLELYEGDFTVIMGTSVRKIHASLCIKRHG